MIKTNEDKIILVCAADDAFAMPLAVMVCSVLNNLSSEMRMLLYVIDGGITEHNKQKLIRSWDLSRVEVEWLTPDLSILNNLKISGHISAAAYLRILIPDIIPEKFHKVIYLDCDLIVLTDIGELWNTNVKGNYLLAVQDISLPYMCSSKVLENYQLSGPYLEADVPLINYQELGIACEYKYFNSGVLVINLEKWQEDNISEAVFNYLNKNKNYVKYWDQDGLNAILAGKWKELDLRWNQGAGIYRYPSWEQSPFGERVYNQIIFNPYIIHFTTDSKPWHYDCSHPERKLFFDYLDMTAWAGWRPKVPVQTLFKMYASKLRQILKTATPNIVIAVCKKMYKGVLTKLKDL